MLIYESEFSKVEWLKDKKLVVFSQFGANRGDFLKDSLNKGIQCLKENNAVKWLSDNRQVGFITPEDVEWVNNDWTPRAIASGWKKWALIQPESAVSRLNLKQLIEFFKNNGVEVKVFTDFDEGLTWLDNSN